LKSVRLRGKVEEFQAGATTTLHEAAGILLAVKYCQMGTAK
jgi:hypothetical protein